MPDHICTILLEGSADASYEENILIFDEVIKFIDSTQWLSTFEDMIDTSTDILLLVHTNIRVLNAAEESPSWSLSSYLCACMVVSALLTLLNTLKKRVIGTVGATYDCAHWFFYALLQHGVTALFSFPYTFTFSCLYLSVCLSICLSVCLSVCLSINLCVSVCVSLCLSVCLYVCAGVCMYVFMYYVYMYVVFIVINVCKLLHVRRPTNK